MVLDCSYVFGRSRTERGMEFFQCFKVLEFSVETKGAFFEKRPTDSFVLMG